jgi:hypothetical protein
VCYRVGMLLKDKGVSNPALSNRSSSFVISTCLPSSAVMTSMSSVCIVAPQSVSKAATIWGASSAAAKIYSKDGRFGPIPAGFRVLGASGGEYGA